MNKLALVLAALPLIEGILLLIPEKAFEGVY
jgi:hypothetical protein